MYRVLMKWFSFFVFGVCTLSLVFPIMPVMLVFIHPSWRFQKCVRRLISAFFRSFIRMMQVLGIVTLETDDAETFRKLSSKIVVSNHPSLLDVVMLISLIPNADVIVRGNLTENIIVSGVVRRLYILNSLDFDKLAAVCKESLDRGNCLVIFPEGTRTPRSGVMRLKRGAARLALMTGAEILAVHIGGNDKYGLGKGDPFTAFNHVDKYIYRVRIQGRLDPAKYADEEIPRAARHLNEEILNLLCPRQPDDAYPNPGSSRTSAALNCRYAGSPAPRKSTSKNSSS
jgi:1-acyl-sn-glycerol-3-phosphate acyltransferase